MNQQALTAALLAVAFAVVCLPLFAYMAWIRERNRLANQRWIERERREEHEKQRREAAAERAERRAREAEAAAEREERRAQAELEFQERRLQAEEDARYSARRLEQERIAAAAAGSGSGGYIVVDMPETERPLFHDLLKGFEDYGKLKGYHIAFSIDSSAHGRIAFKFTIKDEGVAVGAERVRSDFKEFLEQVRNKDIDDLDNLPVIVSIEEHNLVVAHLKNRISFLQHNYNLAQTSVRYYEHMIANVPAFPALPSPTVIVQNGNNMDSRKYIAKNSQRLIQGDSSSYTDSSINIGNTVSERQTRIAELERLIDKLKAEPQQAEAVKKAAHELVKVRDELADDLNPDEGSIMKWLERAKNLMTSGILTYETVEAAKKVWELFGMS